MSERVNRERILRVFFKFPLLFLEEGRSPRIVRSEVASASGKVHGFFEMTDVNYMLHLMGDPRRSTDDHMLVVPKMKFFDRMFEERNRGVPMGQEDASIDYAFFSQAQNGLRVPYDVEQLYLNLIPHLV